MITNRTIDSYGVYTGESDPEYAVEILDRKVFDPPTFHRSSSGSITDSWQMVVTSYTNRQLLLRGSYIDQWRLSFTWQYRSDMEREVARSSTYSRSFLITVGAR